MVPRMLSSFAFAPVRLVKPVFALALLAGTLWLPAIAEALKPADLVAAVAPSLVRVEFELQFDKGDAPTGAIDHDPGSRTHANHSLADVIREERPLEDTGFLLTSDTVVIPDTTIHPRFIKAIHVATRTGRTTARLSSYGRDGWFAILKLQEALPDAKPLEFVAGQKAAYIATYYRAEGGMLVDLAPFSGRFQQPDGRTGYRVAESTGLAVNTNGAPVGLIFSHRLAADDSWQGSPIQQALIPAETLAQATEALAAHSQEILPRVRLSFRSPKTPAGQGRERFRGRNSSEDEENDDATEQDELGLVLSANRVAVLANMKSSKTARLRRITIHPPGSTEGIGAKFIASLRDFGVVVVEPEKPITTTAKVYTGDLRDLLEKLILKAEIDLQGEVRKHYFHESRFGLLRTGPRLES